MDKNDLKEKYISLSEEIFKLTRNSLIVSLRFLDVALCQFEFVPKDDIMTFETDGKNIFYNLKYFLNRYKDERQKISRDYLHMVMHLIFKHPFKKEILNEPYYNLASDIAVENIINEIDLRETDVKIKEKQLEIINNLKENINILTAEKIYKYFIDINLSDEKLKELNNIFVRDSHEHRRRLEVEKIGQNDNNNDNDMTEEGNTKIESDSENFSYKASKKEIEDLWQDISESIKTDLDTMSKDFGDKSESLKKNIRDVHKDKYDYKEFLKKFSVMGESMVVNDDEFDYIFYTYGLKLYDNMPLIEPLEYKEVKKIKDFVIAIDTSGSCSGELVEKFIRKTYSIMKDEENFFNKINIHIIQCDNEIKQDKKITNDEEFNEYIKNLELFGFGGTDFRPVFNYVNELLLENEFDNLKGLIYFTDGIGIYPEKKPDFETCFVFLEDSFEDINVPPWAIKVILTDDDILN